MRAWLLRRWRAGRDRLRGWLAAYAPWLAGRLPAVRIDTGWWVPGWVLRLLLGALAAACLVPPRPGGFWAVVLSGYVVALMAQPGGVLPASAVAVVAVQLLVAPELTTTLRIALTILGLHAVAQLGVLAGRAGPFARFELRVLALPLPRFLIIQVIAQTLALVGAWLSGRAPEVDALPVLAILGLAAAVLGWLPGLGRSGAGQQPGSLRSR